MGIFLILIAFTYLLDWQRKHAIDTIPALLAKMDSLVLDYIDAYVIPNTSEDLVNDLAKLMRLDITELKAAATSGNKNRAEQEFAKFVDKHNQRFNSKNYLDNITNLCLAGAIMNEYKVGLIAITTTREYQNLYQKVRNLRRQLPSVVISRKINEYLSQSEGLYNMLLSVRPFEGMGSLKEVIPVKLRAYNNIVRPVVEGQTAMLISAVQESIDEYKNTDSVNREKNKGKRIIL